jgi:threonine/homoserine/homoserine lactone efflux protein
MPSALSLLLFSGAALVLLVVPGPAVLYIVARSASQGRRAGLVSVAGIHTGTVVHVLAALLGLSALVVASATAFSTVKLAGAAYLVYLGVRALTARGHTTGEPVPGSSPDRPLRRVFADGVVLNILNPKTALFFLAFVPQFVDVGAGHPSLQLLVLSALFIGLGLVSDGCYALAGSWLGGRLSRSPRSSRRADLAAGTSYIGLGLVTALAGDGRRA